MTTQKNYDVLLFDLDGTLTDPKPGITRSVQYSLASFGIIEPCADALEKFIGPPLKDSFMEYYAFSESKAEAAVQKYREYFAEKGLYENAVYPFIPRLLENLAAKGKTLMIATSKPTVFAVRILEHFGLSRFFTRVIGSNLDGSRVKKEEVIRYALEEARVTDYDRVVMIGDRKHDILGARAAGIDSVGILYGYGSREELEAVKPTHLIDTVINLERLLYPAASSEQESRTGSLRQ